MLTLLLLALPAFQQTDVFDVRLSLPKDLPASFSLETKIGGQTYFIDFEKYSLRSADFILKTSRGIAGKVPPSRTYFGSLHGVSGAVVVGTLTKNGLIARIQFPNEPSWWRIKPNRGKGQGWHRLFLESPDEQAKCGVGKDEIDLKDGGQNNLQNTPGNAGTPPGGQILETPPPGWADWTVRRTRYAFDADHCFYTNHGGSNITTTLAAVEQHLAEYAVCYFSDGMVTPELAGVVIRDQPYYSFTSAGNALSTFAWTWDNYHWDISRDTAYLLTDYQNDGIAGIAYVGTLGGWSYGATTWNCGWSPGIMAHEIGHNWGAGHIDCWPWGGSSQCGAWLLLGPETSNIVRSRALWLNLPIDNQFDIPVRPYADPDYATVFAGEATPIDVLANDHDANFDPIHISGFDAVGSMGGIVELSASSGPGGRDEILFTPDPMRTGGYEETFWYTNSDPSGLTHSTPVTVTVKKKRMLVNWKFNETSGNIATDSTGFGNDGLVGRETIYAPLASPDILGGSYPYSINFSISNLTDGHTDTEYASASQGPVTNAFSQNPSHGTWVEFDFGSTVQLDGLRFLDRQSSQDWIGESRLIFSADAQFDSSDSILSLQHYGHGQSQDYLFARQSARYLRWEVTAPYDTLTTTGNLGGADFTLLTNADFVGLDSPTVSLASRTVSGYPAGHLVDGNLGTEFIGAAQGVTTQTYTTDPYHGTWVEMDFGTTVELDGIQFLDRANPQGWIGRSRLIFSTNSTFNSADPQVILTHRNPSAENTSAFPHQTCRYVRWEIIGTYDPTSIYRLLGGREMTFLQDLSSSISHQWVQDGHEGALELMGLSSVQNTSVEGMPTDSWSPWTVNCWVWIDQTLSGDTLIAGIGDSRSPFYDLRFFRSNQGNIAFCSYQTSYPLAVQQWQMLTATYRDNKARLFLNGEKIATFDWWPAANSPQAWVAPLLGPSGASRFIGRVDEFSAFSWKLSQDEVAALYQGGPPCGPLPQDGARTIATDTWLQWTPGFGSPRQDLYFGTNWQAVLNADHSSPEYQGRQTQFNFDPGLLASLTTYYWRVDQVFTADGAKGPVWRFTTELDWTSNIREGFEDGVEGNDLAGLGGGEGFGGYWNNNLGSGFIKRSGSFGAYPANIPFAESGGFLEAPQQTTGDRIAERPIDLTGVNIDLGGDDTYYLSFAAKAIGGSSYPTIMLGLWDSQTGQSLAVGSAEGTLTTWGVTGSATAGFFPRNRANFFVVKIQAAVDGPDILSMKLYESSSDLVHNSDADISGVGTGADEWDFITSGSSDLLVDYLTIQLGSRSTVFNAFVQIDEIRVGRSWNDVTGL